MKQRNKKYTSPLRVRRADFWSSVCEYAHKQKECTLNTQQQLKTAVAVLLLLLLMAGCKTFDPVKVREKQRDEFSAKLAEQGAAWLSEPLTLEGCIAIAMTNNYSTRMATIDRTLKKFNRNIAFSAFLPQVEASANYLSYRKTPNPMSEKRYGDASLQANLPIFMPSAWFMYAAARHGLKVAELAENFIRQTVVLEVSQGFYQVLIMEDTVAAIQTQLDAAEEAMTRIVGLAEEGFVTAWERDQARLLVSTRQSELEIASRQLNLARNDLLVSLGLAPVPADVATLRLYDDQQINQPVQPLLADAELVLKALTIHPLMSITDRLVVIREHEVRRALTAFLPIIGVSGSADWTGNDLAMQSANWMTAFGATWQLFKGFSDMANYRVAKAEKQQSELQREMVFLNIMAQVMKSSAAVKNATAETQIRQQAWQVAAGKFADYDARSREGLLPLSEALDARAEMDLAQMEFVKSRYQQLIALAGLDLAMGLSLSDEPESDYSSKFVNLERSP